MKTLNLNWTDFDNILEVSLQQVEDDFYFVDGYEEDEGTCLGYVKGGNFYHANLNVLFDERIMQMINEVIADLNS